MPREDEHRVIDRFLQQLEAEELLHPIAPDSVRAPDEEPDGHGRVDRRFRAGPVQVALEHTTVHRMAADPGDQIAVHRELARVEELLDGADLGPGALALSAREGLKRLGDPLGLAAEIRQRSKSLAVWEAVEFMFDDHSYCLTREDGLEPAVLWTRRSLEPAAAPQAARATRGHGRPASNPATRPGWSQAAALLPQKAEKLRREEDVELRLLLVQVQASARDGALAWIRKHGSGLGVDGIFWVSPMPSGLRQQAFVLRWNGTWAATAFWGRKLESWTPDLGARTPGLGVAKGAESAGRHSAADGRPPSTERNPR